MEWIIPIIGTIAAGMVFLIVFLWLENRVL